MKVIWNLITWVLRQWIFWLILVFVIVAFFVIGCKDGETSTRRSIEIYCDDNGIDAAWFAYVDYDGVIIRQPGLKMNFMANDPYYMIPINGGFDYEMVHIDPSIQHVESKGCTGSHGCTIINGIRNKWDYPTIYTVHSSGKVCHPLTCMINGIMNYQTRSTPRVVATSSYASGTLPEDILCSQTSSLTDNEQVALDNPTDNPPDSGVALSAYYLIARGGSLGNDETIELDGLMPINLETVEEYFRYAAPIQYSIIFKTAESVDIDSAESFNIKIKTNACPSGINIGLNVIGSNSEKRTHIARTDYFLPIDSRLPISNHESIDVCDKWTPFDSEPNIWNPEQYACYVKDNWLDCVDPNLYADPNTIPDPNVLFDAWNPEMHIFVNRLDTSYPGFIDENIFIPERVIAIKVIPIHEIDEIYYEFDENQWTLVMKALPFWLDYNILFDKNNDGIINLEDLF